MNKQTGLLGKPSWTKRTDAPLTPMKRPPSKPSPRKKKKRKLQRPNSIQSDSLHKLNRPEQVIVFRLRTGHNKLNVHMYKFKVGEYEMCPCNADIMTAEHLLQPTNYKLLWGGTCGKSRHYWGTRSLATWRSWGQPLSYKGDSNLRLA